MAENNTQNNKKYISETKRDELKEELDHLKNTRRGEVAKAIERAKAMGDLSENAEYEQAREDQATMEGRIAEIEELLRSAEIVKHKKSDVVQVGSTVSIRKKHASKEKEYTIVGEEETDMTKGHIAHSSPIGAALLNKKIGDVVEIKTPNGDVEYTVESVE